MKPAGSVRRLSKSYPLVHQVGCRTCRGLRDEITDSVGRVFRPGKERPARDRPPFP